jgi:hypothetical protein
MAATEKPFIEGEFLLRRMEGKGGWTYVVIPAEMKNPEVPFGWLKVTGRIDAYDLGQMKLMPVKGGGLFLPVKAAIRKAIKKEAGDTVFVLLRADTRPYGIPDEIVECLKFEDGAYGRFLKLSESEQKRYVDWIYDAKTEETKVRRIAQLIAQVMG